MSIKKAIKYEICTSGVGLGLFYLIMFLLRLVIVGVTLYTGSKDLNMSAMEANTWIFMVILGSLTFVEDFKFLIQNGHSRKTMLKTFAIIFVVMGFVSATLDMLYEVLTVQVLDIKYESLFAQIYGNAAPLLQWLWGGLLNVALCMASFFVTVLFFRLTKAQRILYLLAIPIVVVALFATWLAQLAPVSVVQKLQEVLSQVLGVFPAIQPWNPVIFFGVVCLALLGLSHVATKKVSPYLG